MTVDLEEVVGSLPNETTEEDLLAAFDDMAQSLGLKEAAGREMLITTARDLSLFAVGEVEPAWGGGWTWNLSENVVKSACSATLLAAALASAGVSGIAPIVVPAVIQTLFDIKRVRLDRSEDKVLRIFGANPILFERIGDAQELYQRLPEDVREALPLADFEEFLNKAVAAGRATASGDVYEVLPDGEKVFRLSLS